MTQWIKTITLLKPNGYYTYMSSLTFSSFTFCPQSALACFVCISEQTATFGLYNINRTVFIKEAESVYCAVRTESLNKTDYFSSLKGWVSPTWRFPVYIKIHGVLYGNFGHVVYGDIQHIIHGMIHGDFRRKIHWVMIHGDFRHINRGVINRHYRHIIHRAVHGDFRHTIHCKLLPPTNALFIKT
jgi:hypothetical protein